MQKYYRNFFVLIVVLTLLLLPVPALAEGYSASPNKYPDDYDNAHLEGGMLYATSAVAVDVSSGRVLFEKKMDRKIFPASTTKVLTALLSLEKLDLDQVVTVSSNCLVGESSIYLEEGEQISVRDLLYGLMLKSGNDAAVALAEAVSGSVESFAELMNQRFEELGCMDSHFENANGLPNSNHYTTAYDYSRVVLEAFKHKDFVDIVSTQKYELHSTRADGTPRTYVVTNTNSMLPSSGESFAYDYMIGGKTGYTDAAQHAFVGLSEKDGIQVLTVVFGSTKEGKWQDTKHLADYVFKNYTYLPLADLLAEHPITINVEEAGAEENAQLELRPSNSSKAVLVSESELRAIQNSFSDFFSVNYENDPVKAPVQEGSVIGQLFFTMEESMPIAFDLQATRTIASALPQEIPSATTIPSETSHNGVRILTSDVSSDKWSPLYLLVIIPIVLFFILIVWLIVEIHRSKVYKREMERKRRDEEVNRRRALRQYEHLQSSPMPRSHNEQAYHQKNQNKFTPPRDRR